VPLAIGGSIVLLAIGGSIVLLAIGGPLVPPAIECWAQMIMIDQTKRLSEPLRWTRAGRLAVIAAGVSLLIAVASVAVVASRSGSGRHAGCIEVTFASTLGAAMIHPCGARARALCANPADDPAAAAHGALREACRQAGLPYGRPAVAG
jgi:hypothetical protein